MPVDNVRSLFSEPFKKECSLRVAFWVALRVCHRGRWLGAALEIHGRDMALACDWGQVANSHFSAAMALVDCYGSE